MLTHNISEQLNSLKDDLLVSHFGDSEGRQYVRAQLQQPFPIHLITGKVTDIGQDHLIQTWRG